jgi:hypothetical protein
VGASLLAKVANENAGRLIPRSGVLLNLLVWAAELATVTCA